MRRAAAPVLAGAALFASLLAPAGQDPAPAADSVPAFPAVNYAVAVDESASLSPEDMKAEKAAAARIALGDVSSDSHVTVFGFAAAESGDQRAVDPVCPRTGLDAAGRETIGACVGKLHSRTKDEGTGTDFPSAIRQGVHDLTDGTDATQPRVLFLLTDGYMDVTDSSKYGPREHREAEGERQLGLALKEAAAQNVQIWPLGFGSDPRLDELKNSSGWPPADTRRAASTWPPPARNPTRSRRRTSVPRWRTSSPPPTACVTERAAAASGLRPP